MAGRRMGVMLLLFCLFLYLMPCSIQAVSTSDAAEFIVPDRDCTLTLTYRCDGTAFAEKPIRLYRVAEVSADFQYTLTSAFASSGLILNGVQTNGEWNVIRSTLESHILANGIEATQIAMTDAAGQVCFTPLKTGLYLAAADREVQDGTSYSFDTALVSLPGLDADGLWQYRMEVTTKTSVTRQPEPDVPTAENEIQLKILKLWRGDDGETKRPASVSVEIFRDGEWYQTVSLSEENHWSYTWTAADDGAEWMAAEQDIPVNYSATIEKRGTDFILTNTLYPEPSAGAPQTGDTPNVLFYTILMSGSGIALVLLALTEKRKKI